MRRRQCNVILLQSLRRFFNFTNLHQKKEKTKSFFGYFMISMLGKTVGEILAVIFVYKWLKRKNKLSTGVYYCSDNALVIE